MLARGGFCKPIFACDSCREVIASSGLSTYHVMISRLLQYRTESSANERAEVGKGALLNWPGWVLHLFPSSSALSQTQGDHKSSRELGDIILGFSVSVRLCSAVVLADDGWKYRGLGHQCMKSNLKKSQATGCYYRS